VTGAARRISEVCVKSPNPRRRVSRDEIEGVMRALEEAMQNDANTRDPIVEQLKQCTEAFKVGEILGKAFDSLKYTQNEDTPREPYLPPSGAILPPLV
jgi:hypothetical protein